VTGAGEVIGVRDTRRTRVVLVVLLVVALGLIAVSYSDGSNGVLRGVRNAAGAVFGGAEHAAGAAGRFFTSGGSSASQVKSLQEQVIKLRAELSGAQLSKSDLQQLRKLLLLAGAAQYRVVAASVIAVGTGYQQTVTIDIGSSNGVKPDETVLNGEGLVGQVTSVTSTTATVQLADSPTETVGAQVAPSGELGSVTGPGKTTSGDGLMHLEMLSSSAVLKPGDELVTAASVNDRPFVPGVPIGVITKLVNDNGALTEAAEVRPFVDYTALGVVAVVIVPPRHNPRFSALPPLPHPAPTVTVTVTARPAAGRAGSAVNPTPGG
jgi:rod shape-determining protein MreC